MGIIYEVEESGFTGFIEDGEYFNARVVDVDLVTKPFIDEKTNQPVKKFSFKFKLMTEDEHDGSFIWGETAARITNHPDNRFRMWAEAITGHRIPATYKGNTDDLMDRDCRVVVGKSVKERDGQEKIRNFVREVHPTKENAARLAAEDTDEPF